MNGLGLTVMGPRPQFTVALALTSALTSATAGTSRSKASWTERAEEGEGMAARPAPAASTRAHHTFDARALIGSAPEILALLALTVDTPGCGRPARVAGGASCWHRSLPVANHHGRRAEGANARRGYGLVQGARRSEDQRGQRDRSRTEDDMADRLISCDDHMDLSQLPADLWTTRLPASLLDRAPHVEERDGQMVWVCDGKV